MSDTATSPAAYDDTWAAIERLRADNARREPQTPAEPAEESVRELEAEYAALSEQWQDATSRGDNRRMIELEERAAELPSHLFAARMRDLQRQMEALREQQVAVSEQMRTARPEVDRAHAAFKAAEARLKEARGRLQNLKAHDQQLFTRHVRLRNQIAALAQSHSDGSAYPPWRGA